MAGTTQNEHADRILRIAELMRRCGLSRSTLWRKVRNGTFPAPVQLSQGCTGWWESEVAAWLASRPRVTYAPQPSDPGPQAQPSAA